MWSCVIISLSKFTFIIAGLELDYVSLPISLLSVMLCSVIVFSCYDCWLSLHSVQSGLCVTVGCLSVCCIRCMLLHRVCCCGPGGRRYRSIAARPALSSNCEQCHAVSWPRKLNTDLLNCKYCIMLGRRFLHLVINTYHLNQLLPLQILSWTSFEVAKTTLATFLSVLAMNSDLDLQNWPRCCQDAKYLGQWSFHFRVMAWTLRVSDTQAARHTRPVDLFEPLRWQ